ncbi:MAG: hypothetical protein EBT20_14335, partial [Alphaproteobacteria bacterium]|nr:hypothetical protein [Alphaproteobacteria bacterium]
MKSFFSKLLRSPETKLKRKKQQLIGFHTSLIFFSAGLASKSLGENATEASYFVAQSGSVAFAFRQNNGEFWIKLTDGSWVKVPEKFVFLTEGVVTVSQDWLIANAPSLISNPRTVQGDYVAFEIGFPKAPGADGSPVTFLQANIPGITTAEFMSGGSIAIRLDNGSSIALNPNHFSIFENKVIISQVWLEANLPGIASRVGKDFGFPSLVGVYSNAPPQRYENKSLVKLEDVKSINSYDNSGFEIILETGKVLLVPAYNVKFEKGQIFLNELAVKEISQRAPVWAEGYGPDEAGAGGAARVIVPVIALAGGAIAQPAPKKNKPVDGDDFLTWMPNTVIDGGAGTNTLELKAPSESTITLDNISNIQKLILSENTSSGVSLVAPDSLVAPGEEIEIDARNLDSQSEQGLIFDGSSEADGDFLIYGSKYNDFIIGGQTPNSDVIIGGAGDDTIDAGPGKDTITGGDGADTIMAGAGDDVINYDNGVALAADHLVDGGIGSVYLQAPTNGQLRKTSDMTILVGSNEEVANDSIKSLLQPGTQGIIEDLLKTDFQTAQILTITSTEAENATFKISGIDSNGREITEDLVGPTAKDGIVKSENSYVKITSIATDYTTLGLINIGNVGHRGSQVFEVNGITIEAEAGSDVKDTRSQIKAAFDGKKIDEPALFSIDISENNYFLGETEFYELTLSVLNPIDTDEDTIKFTENSVTDVDDADFANVSNIETVTFSDGDNTASFGSNAATASGAGALNINSGSGNDTIDASALGKSAIITSGSGDDQIIGGAGSDTFVLGTNLTSADRIDGGDGADELRFTDNNNDTHDLDGVTNVETVTLGDAATSVATLDNLVTSGKTLTVTAAALSGANSLTWDGSAETDGSFNIT